MRRLNVRPSSQIVGTANRTTRSEARLPSTGVSTTYMMTGLTFDPGLLTHQPPWGQMSSRENLLSNIHDDGSDKELTAASPDSSDRMESSEVLLVDDDEYDDAD